VKVSEVCLKRGAKLFDVDVAVLHFLGGEDGDVYEYEQEGRAYIFKLMPTAQDRLLAIQEKVDFARYLADHGVRISRPLPSPRGNLVEIIAGGDETAAGGDQAVAVFKYAKAPGRHPNMQDPDEWNAVLFGKWGRVVGRMHALTQGYEGGAHIVDWRQEYEFMANWCQDPDVRDRWHRLAAHLEALPRPADAYGLIHNDLHQWNFLVDDGELTVFDFDVCARHWFVTDIGIALFHALWAGPADRTQGREAFARQFLGSFLDGYAEENHLAQVWLKELPHFCQYRRLLLFTVFCEGWTAKGAADWQREWIANTRQRIIDDVPVIELDL
jgi:Ser/Thr protein kinase RdoA (MazF antagonist)